MPLPSRKYLSIQGRGGEEGKEARGYVFFLFVHAGRMLFRRNKNTKYKLNIVICRGKHGFLIRKVWWQVASEK